MKVQYKNFKSTRCFGVELEVGKEVPRSIISGVIKKYSKKKVVISNYTNSINNDHWVLKTDSSCGKNFDHLGQNEGGYEITSYKASGIDDINCIAKISGQIKKIGVKVNHNCGYHIHIDVSDFNDEDMGRLVGYWLCIEESLFSSVPERRKFNQYCKKVRRKNVKAFGKTFDSPLQIYEIFKPQVTNIRNAVEKRYSLNLLNYFVATRRNNFKRKTVEFRFPEGTLTAATVKNYLILLISFVENMKILSSYPKKLVNFKLNETLRICGLDHDEKCFNIFDSDLLEVRKWFLKRLVRYDMSYENMYKKSAAIMIDKLHKRG